MRVLLVEDEPYMAEAIRDGLRLEAIAADIAGDGDTAVELLGINDYDIAVLDRDVPGPSGDEIAKRIVASGSGMPILMLTAADRLQRGVAVAGDVGRDRFQAQAIANGFCQVGLVLNDQHPHAPMLRAGAYRRHIENRIRVGNITLA